MRAALYLRQSLDIHEGIERQRTRAASLAASRSWDVAAEFVDNDTSASKGRGPTTGWGRMLAGVEAGDFDVVIAVDLDRLLRSTRDLNTLIDLGAKVVTVDGEIDLTTADGEFRATMLAGIARFEVRRKSERQKRANDHRAAQGKWVGGRRPFGYDADGLTIREDEAAAIRRSYDSALVGVSLASIGREWDALGLHPEQSAAWSRSSVRGVLLNPRYAGKVRHNGEVVSETSEWEAIVTEETWLAVQALLSNPARHSGKTNGRFLLSGLALCAVCGSSLHAGGNARKGVRAYRCSGALGHVSRMAEPVENYVAAVTVARLARPDAAALLHADKDEDRDAARAELTGARVRLDALAVDYADGLIIRQQFITATERLRTRVAELEATLVSAVHSTVLGTLVGATDVQEAWDGLGLDRQRAVIDALMVVTVHGPGRGTRTFRPETVTIEWKTPTT